METSQTPPALDKALSFVRHGCPTIIDLNTSSREELREKLSHIPYFDEGVINAIVRHRENKRFDDKEELVDAQIIPYDIYGCVAEYIAPIDINHATATGISRLLRGDRFLASRIMANRKDDQLLTKAEIEPVLLNHIPEHFYPEIMGKIALTSDNRTWSCRPPLSSLVARY